MMLHGHFNNKNNGLCVPCVPSCLPLSTNGKHLQALSYIAINTFVYHVYHYARACARVKLAFQYIKFNLLKFSKIFNQIKKFSCVRNNAFNSTHGKHFNESIINKGSPVFTFFKYGKHDGTHHTQLIMELI